MSLAFFPPEKLLEEKLKADTLYIIQSKHKLQKGKPQNRKISVGFFLYEIKGLQLFCFLEETKHEPSRALQT